MVMTTGEIQIRVRYAETDRMGLLHHANYLVYFEQARTELLRDRGRTYKDMEDEGFFLVVAKLEVKYKLPAHYDDVLTVRTTVTRTSADPTRSTSTRCCATALSSPRGSVRSRASAATASCGRCRGG